MRLGASCGRGFPCGSAGGGGLFRLVKFASIVHVPAATVGALVLEFVPRWNAATFPGQGAVSVSPATCCICSGCDRSAALPIAVHMHMLCICSFMYAYMSYHAVYE